MGRARSGTARAIAPNSANTLLIPPKRDLLAEESFAGFRSVMPGSSVVSGLFSMNNICRAGLIVFPAAQALSRNHADALLDSMKRGAWVVWERAAAFDGGNKSEGTERLFSALDIRIRRCVRVESNLYIRYRWPRLALVRAFHEAALLDCSHDEAIAEYGGEPVAMKRAHGHGGFVFLGSMLGPGVRADEPQARQIVQTLRSSRFLVNPTVVAASSDSSRL